MTSANFETCQIESTLQQEQTINTTGELKLILSFP